jgi:hypothetical protein
VDDLARGDLLDGPDDLDERRPLAARRRERAGDVSSVKTIAPPISGVS